jgi:UDP-glucose 4-epimerase
VLAQAICQLFRANVPIQIIGTRHGEKRFESLVSREEIVRAEDLGGYYRIPSDNRDLNYAKYFSEGQTEIAENADYTSDNTEILDVEGVKNLLMSLPYIRRELGLL